MYHIMSYQLVLIKSYFIILLFVQTKVLVITQLSCYFRPNEFRTGMACKYLALYYSYI